MQRSLLSIRAFCLVGTTAALLLFASGCGGGSDGEVTVKTGSLSKAEFVKRADTICKTARTQFTNEYTAFLKRNKSRISKANESALQSELVDGILIPSFKKDVEEISTLGAPSGNVKGVASFLNGLQQRLNELHADPSELSARMFAKPAKLAKAAGLNGCAGSFG